MAGKISLKSSDSAEIWLQRCKELSDEAYQAMTITSQLVTEINQESRGSLADEMVDFGNHLLKSAKVLTDTTEKLSDAVRKVLDAMAKMVDTVSGWIKGATNALTGHK